MSFPTFYGRPGENASDFLDNLEMSFIFSGRDDEVTKLRVFPLVLKEEAKEWYQTTGARNDWERQREAFLAKYCVQEPPGDLWRCLNGLQQRMCVSYKAYEEQFKKFWEKWATSLGAGEGAPNCLKKDCFLNGLEPVL